MRNLDEFCEAVDRYCVLMSEDIRFRVGVSPDSVSPKAIDHYRQSAKGIGFTEVYGPAGIRGDWCRASRLSSTG